MNECHSFCCCDPGILHRIMMDHHFMNISHASHALPQFCNFFITQNVGHLDQFKQMNAKSI